MPSRRRCSIAPIERGRVRRMILPRFRVAVRRGPAAAGVVGRPARVLFAGLVLSGPAAADAQAIFRDGFEPGVPAGRGGSNLLWHDVAGCEREPYGILANYHEPGIRTRVRAQLAQMRANGQERLSLGLFHVRGESDAAGRVTGTVLDSSGGQLHPQQRANLQAMLADVREAGFASFLFRYHPQGGNDPRTWSGFDADRFEENARLIESIEPLLLASGLPHGTDLFVEGMPRARIIELGGHSIIRPDEPADEPWSRYARDLWARYVLSFGTAHTVGFSFISDTDDLRIDARAEHVPYVYTVGGVLTLPIAMAFDLYGTPTRDEGWIFERYHRHLADEGLAALPWVIAETYYDDAAAAGAIGDAIKTTGRPVLFLTQWPLRRVAACELLDVAPPVDYGAWRSRGF
jgi:hypothetical protein